MVDEVGQSNTARALGSALNSRPVAVALWLLILGELVRIGKLAFEANLADVQTYQRGAAALIAGRQIYPEWQLAGPYALDTVTFGKGFIYPPTATPLLVPLLIPGVGELFGLVSAVAFVVIAALIVRRELGNRAALVSAAILLAHPGLHEIVEGTTSMIVAAGIGVMWLRPRWSGWLAVAGAMLKVYPGLGLIWAVRKRADVLTPLAIGIIVAVLLAAAWAPWAVAMLNATPGCPDIGLPSFACGGMGWLGYLLAILLAAAAWRVRDDALSFALLGAAMIVSAPDLYWGYILTPTIASLPLICHGITWIACWVGLDDDLRKSVTPQPQLSEG